MEITKIKQVELDFLELAKGREKLRVDRERPLLSWKYFRFGVNSDEERNFQVELTEKTAR